MKKSIFILVAVVLGMTACNEKEVYPGNINQVDNLNSIAFSVPNRQLTDNQIDSIAILHNHFLNQAITNYNLTATNRQHELYSQFESIGIADLNMSSSEIQAFLDSADNDSYEFIKSNTSNSLVITVLDNIQSFVNSNPDCSFTDITDEVLIQELFARNNLVGSDLELALTFLKTFEKSCYFWFPQIKGGSGIGSDFVYDLDEDLPSAPDWGAIAWADGAGAAGSLLRTWYLAVTPLSWGAIVGAIGFGAAWASGGALLYQLM